MLAVNYILQDKLFCLAVYIKFQQNFIAYYTAWLLNTHKQSDRVTKYMPLWSLYIAVSYKLHNWSTVGGFLAGL
jgi:hypothetical protein